MSKRMKAMSLGNFSGIKKSGKKPQPEPSNQPEVVEEVAAEQTLGPEAKTESEVKPTEPIKPVKTAKSKAKVVKKRREPASPLSEGVSFRTGARERSTRQTKVKEKLVTVNIKIRESQKDWLTKTASTVRNNNTEPVPAAKRVYPQHLINVAIDFLEAAGVDWGEVRNVEELREHLNL